MVDVLSWITTHLGPEAMQAILDGATIGDSQRAKGEDPIVIEGDQQREKEVWVTAGQVLVEMHVTNWVTAQKEDPKLDAVLQWLESKKKTKDTPQGTHFEQGGLDGMEKSSKFHCPLRHPLPVLHLKREEWGSVTLHAAKTHQTAALNGWHQDAGHQGHDHTLSLLQEHFWWLGMVKQMRQVIKACKWCLQYEGGTLKAPLCPIVATVPLDLLHVNLLVLRPCWSWINCLESPMSWFSKTISLSMYWHIWPLIKLQKPLLNFYMEATSISLGPWPGSWVIEVLALPVASLRNCVRSLAFNDCRLCPTTPKQMGW